MSVARLKGAAREVASDALIIGGLGAICFGAAQVSAPAAWALGGAFAAAFGYLIGRTT